jgi:hypothetical protein
MELALLIWISNNWKQRPKPNFERSVMQFAVFRPVKIKVVVL